MEVRATVTPSDVRVVMAMTPFFHLASHLVHSPVRRMSFYGCFSTCVHSFMILYMILRSRFRLRRFFSHLTPSAVRVGFIPPRRTRSLWPSFSLRWCIAAPTLQRAKRRQHTRLQVRCLHDHAYTTTRFPEYKCERDHAPTTRDYCCAHRAGVSYSQPESGIPQAYTTGYGSIDNDSASFASSFQSSAGVSSCLTQEHPGVRTGGRAHYRCLIIPGSSDESEFVEVEAETTPSGGFDVRGRHLGDDVGKDEEEEGWDGIEMEMEL